MTHWERVERWLSENHTFGGTFMNHELAEGLGVSPAEASALIQSHLDAQRSPTARTLYVLHRSGRTSAAVWRAGVRTADARAVSGQYFDDVKRKFLRAVEPDLKRIASVNPRAARQCEAIVEAVGDGAMKLLQIAVGGSALHTDDDESK